MPAPGDSGGQHFVGSRLTVDKAEIGNLQNPAASNIVVTDADQLITGAKQLTNTGNKLVGKVWDFGGETWNVMNFGALGDGTGAALSTRYGSLAAAQVDYSFATSLSQTIDWAAGQKANNTAQAAGGGRVYWPLAHYVSQGTDTIFMRPYVSNFGDGYASWLDFPGNVFTTTGMHPSQYPSYTWRLANAAAVGDSSITLQTPAQTSDFSVGGLAVLRSVQEDAAGFPAFIELVKITAINAGTGVLTLEEPLEDAIADPEIGVTPFSSPLVQNANLHDMRLKSGATNQPVIIWGIYKYFFRNLWLEGGHIFTGNGFTKGIARDINAIVHMSAGVDNCLEVKSGSYRCTFRDIKATVVNDDATATEKTLISLGERSRNTRVDTVEFLAPKVNVKPIASSGAVRSRIRNIDVMAQNCTQIVQLSGSGTSHVLATQQVVDTVRLAVSGSWARGVDFSDTSTANPRGDHVRNVRIVGTQATTLGVTALSASFGSVADAHVYDSVIPGQYLASTGSPTNCHIWNSLTGGPADATTRTNVVEHDVLTTGSLAIPAPAQALMQTITSTTPNNIVATYTMPAHYPWAIGDKIHFRVAGLFAGANNTKNIAIADGAGTLYVLTVAAAITGPVILEGDFFVTAATNVDNPITYRINGVSLVNATVTAIPHALTSPASNVAVPFYIEAWVANAADQVYIFDGELQFSRVEDSLRAAATDSRS